MGASTVSETCDLNCQQRIGWIDAAKGMAIFLVLVAHVYLANVEKISDVFANILGSLHNPTFYLCSGILFSMKKPVYNSKRLLVLKALDLLGPFAIWCILYTVYAKLLISVTQSDYIFSQWANMNKLWFLPVLFLAFCTVVAGEKIHLRAMYLTGILLGGIVAGSLISSMLAKIACYTFIFYIGTNFKTIGKKEKTAGIICIFIWAGIVMTCYSTGVITAQDTCVNGEKLLIALVCAISGGIGFTYIIYNFTKKSSGLIIRVFEYVGRNSLYIYILHYCIIWYMEIMPCNTSWISIGGGVIVALLFPLMIAKAIRGSLIDTALFKPSKLFGRH